MKKFWLHEADNGYIYDKRIFWGVMLLMLLVFTFIAWQNNFDFSYKFNFKCSGLSCENTLLESEYYNPATKYDFKADCKDEWCKVEKLAPGFYGEKEPFLYKMFVPLFIILVIGGLFMNHNIHNKGKNVGIKLALPDSLWKKITSEAKNFTGKLEENEDEDNIKKEEE